MISNANLRSSKAVTTVSLLQGCYFILTGLWPVFHIESFMAISGPKEEIWLTKAMGTLIFIVGVGLLTSGVKKTVNWSLVIIATGAALGFIIIDVTYVWLDVIWPSYLLDAVAELVLLLLWIRALFKASRPGLSGNS